jgi:deoxyribodipyrimidine photo-lyase
MQYRTNKDITDQLSSLDVTQYAKSRNHVDGSVSRISPYVTHGVITTKQCVQAILAHHTLKQAEKYVMELVWKEFFLQVQKTYGNTILHSPVWQDKTDITKHSILPPSLVTWSTDTDRINTVSTTMQETWYLHNHQRMWLASRCCHRAKLDRKKCADRTYYHFVDGELSANHLSRQWVNSTFGTKPYMMNEDNLSKYRPWTTDPHLQWTYEQVSDRLFDPLREIPYRWETDTADWLKTPTSDIISRDPSTHTSPDTLRILTPRRLDETLLADETPTIIVLDEEFAQRHPRSGQRLAFVQQYADAYHTPFVYGSYRTIIEHTIASGAHVLLDERRDPIYRDTQQHRAHHPSVEICRHDWIYTDHPNEPILKFFSYRNKAKPYIKKYTR